MNRSTGTLQAPPRVLLWLVTVIFFLLIVAVLAGLNYITGGQRLGSLIPFVGIAIVGVLVAVVGGAVMFRRQLPRLMWLWATLLAILVVVAIAVGGVFAYRNILPPRYQEQVLTEMPFMRAFMPPTPEGGTVPTVRSARRWHLAGGFAGAAAAGIHRECRAADRHAVAGSDRRRRHRAGGRARAHTDADPVDYADFAANRCADTGSGYADSADAGS
ncbi:MAG: hypothetical protein U0521_09670 [Anaerolineae bacterium]